MSTTSRADAVRIGSSAIVPGHVHGTEDVVADHGLLLGLGDNDHPQYLLKADADHGDLKGLADNDHPQYLLKAGNETVAGRLTMPGPVISTPDPAGAAYNGSLWTTHSSWAMRNAGGGLIPVQIGSPVDGNSAARVDWCRSKYENYMISGPHGPLSTYETIQHVSGSGWTTFSTSLHFTCVVPGICRVTIGGYTEMRGLNGYSRASLSAFVFPHGRWHDGYPFNWTNSLGSSLHRHTETKKAGTTSGDYGYRGFEISASFVSRPGQRCSLGMSANVDNGYDGGVYANFGHLRVQVEVYSNGTAGADDGPAWGAP